MGERERGGGGVMEGCDGLDEEGKKRDGWLTGSLPEFGTRSVCAGSSWTSLVAGVNYWSRAGGEERGMRWARGALVIQPGSP